MSFYDKYDLDEVDTKDAEVNFEPLPDGDYKYIIDEVEEKLASSGNGMVLKLTCSVIDNTVFEGRKVWANINTEHTSAKAQTIGRAQLKQLLVATGLENNLQADIEDLISKEFIGTTKFQKGTNGYSDSNRITKFRAAGPLAVSAPNEVAATTATSKAAY